MLKKANILKVALFATGLSGIVAEYILSTLATYFLGNSTFQWTMILSIMLFAMGLGSRLSKFLNNNLLGKFILIEFILTLLVSFSALISYTVAAYATYNGILIYSMSIAIGFLIGMEIPLVIRINNQFESLKVNISGALENDYYGSLIGGVFFAFIGLPYLGLTYTPFILGGINFLVAIFLYFKLKYLIQEEEKRKILFSAASVVLILLAGLGFSKPIILFGEQKRYKDKIIYSDQSQYQKIIVTQWKDNYWLYLNGNQQLSTLDEWLYHEPLVHPVMKLASHPVNILILGGGDGCAAREVLKYPQVESITLVDLDKKVTDLGKNHPIFTELNENALNHPKVKVLNTDAYTYLANSQNFYDVIIVDFPDPKSIELGRLFSFEFYKMCYKQLRPHGSIVVQAGSPYYATRAFYCVEKTIRKAGFNALPLHNQVLTLGEWGWVIGSKSVPQEKLKPVLQSMTFDSIPTRWLNNDAMHQISSFGKSVIPMDSSAVQVNTIHNPVLPGYYRTGNWDLY
ncbi:polyamine aminopropyltransferase [Rapidithrix thailandica]|uniref:Polyamine aminopropyltransferase n=1 Tax=Rapidithrix thailandica TaxID=413964 RepID=A0AAW9SAD9_9BACT